MKHHYTDPHGVTHTWETPDTHAPLDPIGVMATLLAVTGNLSVQDAANAAALTPDDLIREAQSWAAAQEGNQ